MLKRDKALETSSFPRVKKNNKGNNYLGSVLKPKNLTLNKYFNDAEISPFMDHNE